MGKTRTLGLLGGMSWESTAVYYRLLNQQVRARLGGLHSAPLLLHSIDFAPLAALQHAGDWAGAARLLIDAAQALERGGAGLLLLCTNTMHKVADALSAGTSLPLMHIADPTGSAIRAAGIERVGLLGTRFTMEQEFYRARLQQRFGLQVLVPDSSDREEVHRVIYEELCLGRIESASRQCFQQIVAGLAVAGAQAVIFGCTEIGLLLDAGDVALPVFDTTALHAQAAVDWLLAAH